MEFKYFIKDGNQYIYKPKMRIFLVICMFFLMLTGIAMLFVGKETIILGLIIFLGGFSGYYMEKNQVFILDFDEKVIEFGHKRLKTTTIPLESIQEFVPHTIYLSFIPNRFLRVEYVNSYGKDKAKNAISGINKKRLSITLKEVREIVATRES